MRTEEFVRRNRKAGRAGRGGHTGHDPSKLGLMRFRGHQRSFTDEFKAEIVKRVLSGHRTAGQVARDLDLTETAVGAWPIGEG